MFGFFKDKLKNIVGKFSEKVEQEVNDDFDSKHYYDDEIKTQPNDSQAKPIEEKTEKEETSSKPAEEERATAEVSSEPAEGESVKESENSVEANLDENAVQTEAKPESQEIAKGFVSSNVSTEQSESSQELTEKEVSEETPLSEKVSEVEVSSDEVESRSESDEMARAEKIKEEMKKKFRDDIYKKYNISPKAKEEPVAEPEPVVEETPAAEPEPVVEEAPVAEPEAVVEKTPVAEPEPVVEETPVAEPEPVVEETPIAESEPVVEKTPVAEPEPVIEKTPVAESEPAVEEAPVAEPEPVIEKTPVAEPELVIEEAPVAEPEPVVEKTPVAEPENKDELNNQIHSLETESLFEEVDEGKPIEYQEEKKGFFGKLKDKFFKKDEESIVETVSVKEIEKEQQQEIEKVKEEAEHRKEQVNEEIEQIQHPEKVEEKKPVEAKSEPEKEGFFGKIKSAFTSKTLDESKFEELFFDLEIALLENNVALAVIDKIKQDLKSKLVDQKLNRFQIEKIIAESLQTSITELFDIPKVDLITEIKAKQEKPYVISFVGINGVGKTTNLAKVANYLKKKDVNVLMVAADTFRAAAIEQIQEHADNLDIKLIKHDYGSDAAAVCFDAIKHAKSKDIDVVLIDTAGRSNANQNLMNELEKVIRVSKSDLTLFVGDSLTGNDAVDQAENFNEKVGIDGVILSKADADDKGGTAISIGWILKKPILFIGTGQTYDDLEIFSPELILKNLGM